MTDQTSRSAPKSRVNCPGHSRHWFSVYGYVGVRSPKCVRCGFPNPKLLTTDDWHDLLNLAPHLVDDPERLRERLEDERYGISA